MIIFRALFTLKGNMPSQQPTMSASEAFARAQNERRTAQAAAVLAAVEKRPREEHVPTGVEILESLPFEEFARILLAGPIINPRALALVTPKLATQVAQATRLPGFWRDVMGRCWPDITRLPADMTGARAPVGASDNETWRMFFLRVFDIILDMQVVLMSEVEYGAPESDETPVDALFDRLRDGTVTTCSDVLAAPLVWRTKERQRRAHRNWNFTAAVYMPTEMVGALVFVPLSVPMLADMASVTAALGLTAGSNQTFRDLPTDTRTDEIRLHATPILLNRNAQPFMQYETLFTTVFEPSLTTFQGDALFGEATLNLSLTQSVRGTLTVHPRRIDDTVVAQIAALTAGPFPGPYQRPERYVLETFL